MPKGRNQDEFNAVIAMVKERGVEETVAAMHKSRRTVDRWWHDYIKSLPEGHPPVTKPTKPTGRHPKQTVKTESANTAKKTTPQEIKETKDIKESATSKGQPKAKERRQELVTISMEQLLAENTVLRAENENLKEQLEKMRKALQLFI